MVAEQDRNFSCDERIESRVNFQYSGTHPPCPLRLLKLRLTLNARTQAAAAVRLYIVGLLAAEAAMKTGGAANLVADHATC
jgi:hypothetical protein